MNTALPHSSHKHACTKTHVLLSSQGLANHRKEQDKINGVSVVTTANQAPFFLKRKILL